MLKFKNNLISYCTFGLFTIVLHYNYKTKQQDIMKAIPEFRNSTEAIPFFESARYGDRLIIDGNQLWVSKWNYDRIELTRIDGDVFIYYF